MANTMWNLRKIIDLEKWQTLQDSLSSTTKMAIITVDYKGVPVTTHSLCTPFCEEVRKDPALFQQCKKCDARGGLEAVRLNAPYIYYCHCHIIDLAVPITVDDKYLGAIMAGQVRLASSDGVSLEQIVTISDKASEQKKAALASLYYDMPVLAFHEVQLIAAMLFHLANYIVEEAIHKNLVLDLQEKETPPNLTNHTVSTIRTMRKTMTDTLFEERLKSNALDGHRCTNPTLQPIFTYINEHKSESVSLKKAAALCHISTSYFSRLFAKEVGVNYSNFCTQLKLTWSKQLLKETNLSITAISDELGYNDTGYFIKTFKKHEAMTPLLYRKYQRHTPDRP